MATEHAIAIKVIRLGNPVLLSQDPFDGPTVPVARLALPRAIGPVYSGEQFRCLLSLTRVSDIPVNDLTLTVQIQATTADLDLVEGQQVELNDQYFYEIDTLLDVVGPHVLIAICKYNDGEHVRTLRKTFNFDVLPALALRMRTTEFKRDMEGWTNGIEVHVENVSECTVTIEKCSIESSDWKFRQEESHSELLRPHDLFSWAFCGSGSTSNIGMVQVRWRREPLGAQGSMTARIRL